LLKRATYYGILVGASLHKQAVLRVKDTEVDHSQTPGSFVRSLVSPAEANQLLPELANGSVFDLWLQVGGTRRILEQFDQLVGHMFLSEVGTDITDLKEDPNRCRNLFNSRYGSESRGKTGAETHREKRGRVGAGVGSILKGSDGIAVCWLSYVGVCGLEQVWLHFGLSASGDIFLFWSLMKFGALLKVLTWFE